MVWTAIQQGTHTPGSWHVALYRHFVIAGNRLLQEGLLTWAASPHGHDPGFAGDGICKGALPALTKQLYKLTALCQRNSSVCSNLRGLCFHEQLLIWFHEKMQNQYGEPEHMKNWFIYERSVVITWINRFRIMSWYQIFFASTKVYFSRDRAKKTHITNCNFRKHRK